MKVWFHTSIYEMNLMFQGQNATYGPTDYDLFVGFNRVVSGTFRTGTGLCRAVVTLNTAGGKPY